MIANLTCCNVYVYYPRSSFCLWFTILLWKYWFWIFIYVMWKSYSFSILIILRYHVKITLCSLSLGRRLDCIQMALRLPSPSQIRNTRDQRQHRRYCPDNATSLWFKFDLVNWQKNSLFLTTLEIEPSELCVEFQFLPPFHCPSVRFAERAFNFRLRSSGL